jgi:3-oxoacyl-[acyl-carrier protein] reductase
VPAAVEEGAMKRYDGQVAVVTGASSGIGRRIALDLAERGAAVIALARRASLLESLADDLQRLSPDSSTVVCDVADAGQHRSRLAGVEGRYGRVDVLVNNAGVYESTPITDASYDAYARVMATNFFAPVVATQTVIPGMLARGGGIVVNVSSDSARAPEAREGAYAASKAALSAFSECVAAEVGARGVYVHVLYPAWVPTAMGLGDGTGTPPPRPVRRTEAQVSSLLLERMGTARVDINASRLPLLAVLARTTMPTAYARAMRKYGSRP